MRMNLIVVAAFGLLVAGCAEMSEKSCASTDWHWDGYADGRRTDVPLFEKHARHCDVFGVKPDAAQYRSGQQLGIFDRAHKTSSN